MPLVKPPWFSPIDSLPADGVTVWIKISIYQQHAQATYSSLTQLFTLADSGLLLPWYFVFSWKPL